MNVGELFVEIGIKGDNKVAQALSGIKNGLMDVSAQGLAAKAAIVGAIYALERMTVASGKFGNNLVNFKALTGIDTTKTQQWGEFFRKNGADFEDATSMLLASQKALTQIQRGEGMPSGLARISAETHTNLLAHLQDPVYVADTIRKYLLTTKDSIGMANVNAQSFGLSEGAISAIRRGGNEDIYSIRKNIPSEAELNRLSNVYKAWSNIDKMFLNLRNTLTSKYGMDFIQALEKAIESFIKVLPQIEKGFKNVLSIIKDIKEAVKGLGFKDDTEASTSGPVALLKGFKEFAEFMRGPTKEELSSIGGGQQEGGFGKGARDFLYRVFGAPPSANEWHPPMALPQPVGGKTSSANINIYQQGIQDSHESVTAFRDDIKRAYWQNASIGVVT